ncbi:MAG: 4Fe-4S dicluster domain-containing protein [bacterium]|nr:4Fe-4S dicluster domain-containing protein [bacterium]
MCINREELVKLKQEMDETFSSFKKRVVLCGGTGCMSNGGDKVYDEFLKVLAEEGLDVTVDLKKEDKGKDLSIAKSGCQGFCQMGSLVTVLPDEILYTKVQAADVKEIVKESIKSDGVIDRLLYLDPRSEKKCKGVKEIPFYAKQHRLLLKTCGRIAAESLNEYILNGGYLMAAKAVLEMTDEEICRDITESGIRGRGGGGFSTGLKWDLARKEPRVKKYIICNGDEGDPGAFMDRSVMEGNPHGVLEGMMIAAQAIGADEGCVYVRTEYPLAVERMNKAIVQAEELGVLGNNIFGSGKNFKVWVMEGAGAFVCGEETALMASVEGKRGMPMPKPPFPAEHGLFGSPTVINNVETLATIPVIMAMGSSEYNKIGTKNAAGTKTFAITGHVANTGLIEVPFGTTISEIISDIAGGVIDKDGKINNDAFKAVQIGGPSGGCLTKSEWDLPVDFDSLKSVGAMVGSGGLVVMNDTTCMVSIADFFMKFTQDESCGKCTPCREGTKQMKSMLEDIREGNATPETLETLKDLGKNVQLASLCALGKTAPNPVLSTMKNFKEEYDAHVNLQTCPVGECEDLIEYDILGETCIGCTVCARKCPVDAISGEVKKIHEIDQDKCIKCGVCFDVCKFDAVKRG